MQKVSLINLHKFHNLCEGSNEASKTKITPLYFTWVIIMPFDGSLASNIGFGTSVDVNGRTRDNLLDETAVDVTGRATGLYANKVVFFYSFILRTCSTG